MKNYDIILASNSQRRKELLKYIVEEFKIIPSNIDERKLEKEILNKTFENNLEKFSNLCNILSFKKCKDISIKNTNSLIISADTVVYDDKKLFGKPKDYNDAKHMLEYLSGKEHTVQTSVTIYFKGEFNTFLEKSFVTFYELDDLQKELIKNYIENENPFDKAGGYGIQDKGTLLIKHIKGDYFNIVGLPISKLKRKIFEIINK